MRMRASDLRYPTVRGRARSRVIGPHARRGRQRVRRTVLGQAASGQLSIEMEEGRGGAYRG